MPEIIEKHEREDRRLDIFRCDTCGTIFETVPADLSAMSLHHNTPNDDPREPDNWWSIACPSCGHDVQLLWSLKTIDPNKYRKIMNDRARQKTIPEERNTNVTDWQLRYPAHDPIVAGRYKGHVDSAEQPGDEAAASLEDGLQGIAKLVDERGVPTQRPNERQRFDIDGLLVD